MAIDATAGKRQVCNTVHAPSAHVLRADDRVERAVRELNVIGRRATLDFALAVGEVVIRNFYGGNLEAWRDRGPKATSFRRLAKHPQLPMSAGSLYRCVAIYELCRRLGITSWKHVSTSHIRLVLSLPVEHQRTLLENAEASRWTVTDLGQRVAKLCKECNRTTTKGGRRPRGRLHLTMKKLQKCLESSNKFVGIDDDILEMSSDRARAILEVAERLKLACELLEDRIRPHLSGARSEPPPPLRAGTSHLLMSNGDGAHVDRALRGSG